MDRYYYGEGRHYKIFEKLGAHPITYQGKMCIRDSMNPLGMTGAPKQNIETEADSRFGGLNLWIPHIKSLNCSAVYIGPLFESSTHGYDTRDYKLVDRRLGTNDDFRTFVRLCHEQEIRVVVDGVFNHTGRDFFAFRDICENRESSPYRNWYRGVDFGRNSPMGDPFGYESVSYTHLPSS